MAVRSKWQSLPTEAINPSSLDIDKLAPDEIVELMMNEDRKMLEAVRRERDDSSERRERELEPRLEDRAGIERQDDHGRKQEVRALRQRAAEAPPA